MTYESLADIERFSDRLTAEQVAARFVAMERIHCQKCVEAIEEITKESDE
jgi:hypothetical protein